MNYSPNGAFQTLIHLHSQISPRVSNAILRFSRVNPQWPGSYRNLCCLTFIILKILYSEHQEDSNCANALVHSPNARVNCLPLTINISREPSWQLLNFQIFERPRESFLKIESITKSL